MKTDKVNLEKRMGLRSEIKESLFETGSVNYSANIGVMETIQKH